MKNYSEMTRTEINQIVRTGGDKLKQLNNMVSSYLDGLPLSEAARNLIADTPLDNMAEAFGGLFTTEEVELYVNEVR